MKHKPYPKYKDSGVEWLGDVPEHWGYAKLKWIARLYSGGTPDKTNQDYWSDGTIPWLNSGAVNDEYITEPSEYITEDAYQNSSAKWIPKDALVLALAGQGKTKGMIAQLGIKTTCNQSMAAIVPNVGFSPRYLFWWITRNYNNLRNLAGGDARDGLNLEMIGSIPCPLLLLSEQQAIAAFLDHKTAQIDDLIDKNQELVKRLREKRTAMVSHSVTKGLDPKAKMKPSGVEWLGDVPEHWGYAKLKWIARLYSGGTPDKTNQDYWSDGTIPWLNSGAVNDEYITEPSEYITEDAYQNSSAKWIPKDALVLALAGQGKTKGMIAQLGIKTTCNQSMAAIVPNVGFSPRYLFWWITRNYNNLRNLAGGDARDGLNLEMIGSIPCPLLLLSEQQAIATLLDRETDKLDALIAKVETAIEKLKEYRSALISAAVTGKIDVREAK